jgi:Nitroreductase
MVFRSAMTNMLTPSQLVAALNWRYATRKFDPTKKIPEDVWSALEQALVLAPSSMGLQPWKFFVVQNPEVRARLHAASYRQSQITDCSNLVVFAVHKNIGTPHVEKFIDRVAAVKNVTTESLAGFARMIQGNLAKAASEGRLDTWQTHQVYIALGQFLAAAAVMGVDACPMEGIEPQKYDDVLGLTGGDFTTVVVCAAGYRADDDKYATARKVRFETKDVVIYV